MKKVIALKTLIAIFTLGFLYTTSFAQSQPNEITKPATPIPDPGPMPRPSVPGPGGWGDSPQFPRGPSPRDIPDLKPNPKIDKIRQEAIDRIRSQAESPRAIRSLGGPPFAPLSPQEQQELESLKKNFSREPVELSERQLKAQFDDNDRKVDQYQAKKTAGEIKTNVEQRDLAAAVGSELNETGKGLAQEGDTGGASMAAVVAGESLSFAIDMTPGLGDAKAITEAILGYNVITLQPLSPAERIICVISVVPMGSALRAGRAATRFAMHAGTEAMARTVSKMAMRSSDEAALAAPRVLSHIDLAISRLDRGESILAKLPEGKLADFEAMLAKADFREGAREGVSLAFQKGSAEEIEKFLSEADPAIAMKIMNDLSWGARHNSVILPPQVTGEFLGAAERQWAQILEGGDPLVHIRLPNSAAYEAALRGQSLTPKLIEMKAYNPGRSPMHPGLRQQSSHAGDAYASLASHSEPTILVPKNLEDSYVVPVIEGRMNSAAMNLEKTRIVPQDSLKGIQPQIHFEADQLQHLTHNGPSGIRYFEKSGEMLKFGESGEALSRSMPKPETWANLSKERGQQYINSFSNGVDGIKAGQAQPGTLFFRAQRDGQDWGRWYLAQPAANQVEAEAFADIARHSNAAEKFDVYLVKEKFNYFSGQNIGSTAGKHIQIMIPGEDLMGKEAVNLSEALRKIYFDFK